MLNIELKVNQTKSKKKGLAKASFYFEVGNEGRSVLFDLKKKDVEVGSKKTSGKRKLPYLPRLGAYIEFGNKKITYKHTSALENLLETIDQGWSTEAFKRTTLSSLKQVKLQTKSGKSAPKTKKSATTTKKETESSTQKK